MFMLIPYHSMYGPDVTKGVLDNHKFQLIVRSHQCVQQGYQFTHDNQVLTVFSVANYYTPGSNLVYCYADTIIL